MIYNYRISYNENGIPKVHYCLSMVTKNIFIATKEAQGIRAIKWEQGEFEVEGA